jgi:2-polyprenyl-6-hydroxyphenyl methylase/3-demethylubiquinone-9 3-methyltransferase
MTYDNDELKAILDDIIINIYTRNPIILSDFWDDKGEKNYIDFLRFHYEKILTDFNKIFNSNFEHKRILEISSFLGVADIALAKIGSEVYTYDIPEFQKNENLNELYLKFNIRPSSGYLKDVWQDGLPYPDNHFDAIILSEVIEHLNFNPLPLFQEINRILKKDGIFYITTPNQVNLINRIKIISGRSIRNSIHDSVTQLDQTKHTICGIHWREYTLKEVIQLLDSTGFGIMTTEYSPGAIKTSPTFLSRIFYVSGLLFPGLAESITIIARKKEFRPLKFRFTPEYIKYIKK